MPVARPRPGQADAAGRELAHRKRQDVQAVPGRLDDFKWPLRWLRRSLRLGAIVLSRKQLSWHRPPTMTTTIARLPAARNQRKPSRRCRKSKEAPAAPATVSAASRSARRRQPRFAEGTHFSSGIAQPGRHDFRGRLRPRKSARGKTSPRPGPWLISPSGRSCRPVPFSQG